MRRRQGFYLIIMVALLFSACREPFEIKYDVQDTAEILIVSGYINAGGTGSRYELGYALPIDKENTGGQQNRPLVNALVTIESERGEKYNALGSGNGSYVIPHPMLDQSQRYRLRIQTGQTTYLSEFVPVRVSPEIGEVEWEQTAEGLQIYLNTSDPTNATRYYRWEYEETWIYNSQVFSRMILDGEQVRLREPEEFIHRCFTGDRSSGIYLGNSEELANDAIHRFPIQFIPNLSEKLTERYSLLIRQMPLTKESYVYWEQLRKSSQELGDIFGPMPSELQGNITCVSHPELHVIGMVEAVTTTEKRIYISRNDLPRFWEVDNQVFHDCLVLDTGDVKTAIRYLIDNPNFAVVGEVADNPNNPSAVYGYYYVTSMRCVDCAMRGGLYTPPPFWQDK